MKCFLLLTLLSLNLYSADLSYDHSRSLLRAYQTLFNAQALDKWLEHQQDPSQAQADVAAVLRSKYELMNQAQRDDGQSLKLLMLDGMLIINQWANPEPISQISGKISVSR